MNTRRNFLRKLGALSGALAFSPFLASARGQRLLEALRAQEGRSAAALARDEDFWHLVKQAYSVSPAILNLNNGGVSPQPRVVQEALAHYNRLSNEAPSYYMWRILDKGREPLRARLAQLGGCSAEEVAINRNSSEALETIIFGLRLEAGDEVVLARQDYPNMIHAWKQRAHREGIVLKWVNLDLPSEDEDYLVQAYVEQFSARTRVVHLTHMINWCGQVLPVQAIARQAHRRGIEVVVDGAHTFAHFPFSLHALECDYFGASLHKWLCAPFGSGLLYVRREKIRKLYPLLAAPDPEADDIRKFEHLGTRSFPIEQAIGHAIDFHEMIGGERKAARLHYLKRYWMDAVRDLPRIRLGTPLHTPWSYALGLFAIEGMEPADIANRLFNEYKIHTVAINWENIHGVRVTPNVYTLTSDLDRLVEAIRAMAR